MVRRQQVFVPCYSDGPEGTCDGFGGNSHMHTHTHTHAHKQTRSLTHSIFFGSNVTHTPTHTKNTHEHANHAIRT